MLISLPFLKSGNTDAPAATPQLAYTGQYPVTSYLEWHNGQHLIAPTQNGAYLDVRAIADGTVIHVTEPDKEPSKDKAHPQNYAAFGSGPEWTDKGMVIIEHNTEIGANGTTPTTLTYYSVYAHLKELAPGIAKDKKVYRKDVLGKPGRIYGEDGHIHFEVCLDDANIEKLLGQSPTQWPAADAAPTKDGRIDVVFGSTYVYLPASTPVQTSAPTNHMRSAAQQTLNTPQWVQISYAGSATYTCYKLDGTPIGNQGRTEADAEYDLYKEANLRHNSLGASDKAHSSPSGWYELLRFGRNLGRGPADTAKDPLPATAAHWRKINTAAGEQWADLNAVGSFKFSDADFPAFLGWNCFGDDLNPADQRCDSRKLKALLTSRIAVAADKAEALKDPISLFSQTSKEDIKDKLRKAICKFPSEFDQGNIDQRCGHIREEPFFADDTSGESWKKLSAHIKALTVADLPSGYKDAQWHLHPLAFIEVMRKCGWLSRGELHQVYRKTSVDTIERYISSFNKMTRKYGFNTKLRLPHILGQGAIESDSLNNMQESAQAIIKKNGATFGGAIYPDSRKNESEFGHWWGEMQSERVDWYGSEKFNSHGARISSSYNWRNGNLDDPDAQKFRGRGFKQLTGLINYSEYWVFRGWLDRSTFDDSWWIDRQYVAKNKKGMKKKAPIVNDPHLVATISFNCMDSGGWYLSFQRPKVLKEIDKDLLSIAVSSTEISNERAISRSVTHAINGGYTDEVGRLLWTRRAKEIIYD